MEAFICAKLKHTAWKTQFCQVRWQFWQKGKHHVKFFVFRSRSKTTHLASFLFSDNCFSAAQIAQISALTVASLDKHLVLHARCNYWPFVFIIVWCIARQADRNGETVKHFHNCIEVILQVCTPYCNNLRQYSNRPKRGGVHDNVNHTYKFRFQLLQKIVSAL